MRNIPTSAGGVKEFMAHILFSIFKLRRDTFPQQGNTKGLF